MNKAILVLLWVMFATCQTHQTKKIDKKALWQSAMNNVLSKNHEAVTSEMSELITLDSNCLECYFFSANALTYTNIDEAINSYTIVLKNINNWPFLYSKDLTKKGLEKATYYFRANAFLTKRDYGHSISDMLNYMEFDSTSIYGLNFIGTAYIRLDSIDKALAYYNKAYTLTDTDYRTVLNISQAYLRKANGPQALLYAEKAHKLKATDEAYLAKAMAFELMKNTRLAETNFKAAFAINSQNPDIYYRYSEFRLAVGDTDDYCRYLDTAAMLNYPIDKSDLEICSKLK